MNAILASPVAAVCGGLAGLAWARGYLSRDRRKRTILWIMALLLVVFGLLCPEPARGDVVITDDGRDITAEANTYTEAATFVSQQMVRLEREYPDAAIRTSIFKYSSGRIEINIYVMRKASGSEGWGK